MMQATNQYQQTTSYVGEPSVRTTSYSTGVFAQQQQQAAEPSTQQQGSVQGTTQGMAYYSQQQYTGQPQSQQQFSTQPLTQQASGYTQQSETRLPSTYVTSQYATSTIGDAASQQQYVSQQNYGAYSTNAGRSVSEMSRIVGHEYGQERIISVTQHVDESKTHIVGERYVEHEVKVPKRIVREEVIEKVIVVPEKIIQEEIVEEVQVVKEKIVEIARPIIVEKIVEVPEYEYVEKIVEVPEKIVQERVKHVDKVEFKDRIQEVVKVIPQERIVEVPDIQYREVPVERVVEVPEWRDEIIMKEVPVPQYVDKPVPNVVQVESAVDVERNIPVPVEANITYEFRIPRIKPRYHKVTYPVYLPRFIEVPVALDLLQGGLLQQTEMYLQQIGALTKAAASLCEIENLATSIMKADIQSKVSTTDMQSVIMTKWREGTLNVQGTVF